MAIFAGDFNQFMKMYEDLIKIIDLIAIIVAKEEKDGSTR